jgi:signal peptidase II
MLNFFKKADHLKGKTWVFVAIVLICIIADQATKQMAEPLLILHKQNVIFPWLNWTLVYNPGAAFSFLADQSGWQRWFFTGLSSIISVFLFFWIKKEIIRGPFLALALSLILAGAIGNLIDRSIYGHVIDIIQVHYQNHYWHAFNIADSVISIGAVLLLIESFFMHDKEK